MSRYLRPAALGLVALCGVMSACNDGPISPDRGFSHLLMSCTPAGANVSCTATLYEVPAFGDVRDVTAEATWFVSDPSLGGFSRPGLFTPVGNGEVGLWARYEKWQPPDQFWFLVGPSTAARWLYFLSGSVDDAETHEHLVGAEVRILDGYAAGAVVTTNQSGYYTIDRVLTGEDFTVVASKDGYSPQTQSYRVDPPNGPNGNPPFLNFQLTPLP